MSTSRDMHTAYCPSVPVAVAVTSETVALEIENWFYVSLPISFFLLHLFSTLACVGCLMFMHIHSLALSRCE